MKHVKELTEKGKHKRVHAVIWKDFPVDFDRCKTILLCLKCAESKLAKLKPENTDGVIPTRYDLAEAFAADGCKKKYGDFAEAEPRCYFHEKCKNEINEEIYIEKGEGK